MTPPETTQPPSLSQSLAEAHLDALLMTRDANQRFLEGYTGSESYLLASPSGGWLVTDSRYSEQAEHECRHARVVRHRDPFPPYAEVIVGLARQHGLRRIGFEKAVLSYGQYEAIQGEAVKAGEVELIPTEGIVERLRMVKSPLEIEFIRTACRQGDEALQAVLGELHPGMSELELARKLEYCIARVGGEGPAFPTIVAFGARASQPHAVPSPERELAKGELVLIDFGVVHRGYCSDMTRTLIFGQASARQKEVYATVLEAQRRGIEAMRGGISGRAPDAASREYVAARGFPEFQYGVGHGVGLEVHEQPFMSRKSQETLAPGMVITCEPGIYLPDWGGVRIEDVVLVGESGPDCLTKFPKDTLLEV